MKMRTIRRERKKAELGPWPRRKEARPERYWICKDSCGPVQRLQRNAYLGAQSSQLPLKHLLIDPAPLLSYWAPLSTAGLPGYRVTQGLGVEVLLPREQVGEYSALLLLGQHQGCLVRCGSLKQEQLREGKRITNGYTESPTLYPQRTSGSPGIGS